MSESRQLFQPLKIGNNTLNHRIVMAPLTRLKANDEHVHGEVAVEYYSQRSIVPGTLLITEATFIAEEAGGLPNAPGIYSRQQIEGWKKVTDAVHAKKGFIYVQLWALGRAAKEAVIKSKGHDVVSASAIPFEGGAQPRALTEEEIQRYIKHYEQAAKNAIEAGFDGVEIHGANGYLIDQFLQDVSNQRDDQYGGSIENRARFPLEVVKAVTDAIGQERTAIRLSPFGTFQGMKMSNPIPTFSYLINQLVEDYPNLAYLHMIEPIADPSYSGSEESLDFALNLWSPRPFLSAGGYEPETAISKSQARDNVAIVFGRYFISNPDLALRIQYGIPLTQYNRDTFYLPGPQNTKGYTDYPFASFDSQSIKTEVAVAN